MNDSSKNNNHTHHQQPPSEKAEAPAAVVGVWATFKAELAGPYFPETTTSSSTPVAEATSNDEELDDIDLEKEGDGSNKENITTNTSSRRMSMTMMMTDDQSPPLPATALIMTEEMIQDIYFPAGWKILLAKLLLRGFPMATYILQFTSVEFPHFTMAFLTNWSLLATVLYMILSFVSSLTATYYSSKSTATLSSEIAITMATTTKPSSSTTSTSSMPPQLHNFFYKSIAIMFPIVAVQELLVIFFWVSPMWDEHGVTPSAVLAHGPLVPLILIDGLLINHIPVRPRQIVFVWAFQTMFLLWTMLYSAFDIMNPNNMNMNMDEALYEGYLNWRLYPGKTIMGAILIVCMVTPVYFGFVWALSYGAQQFWKYRQLKSKSNEDEAMITTTKHSVRSLLSSTSKTTKHSTSNKSLMSADDDDDDDDGAIPLAVQEDSRKDVLGLSSSGNNNNTITIGQRRGVRARRRSTKSRITLGADGEEIITEVTV